MTEPLDLDEHLARLRDRAADPDRRTSFGLAPGWEADMAESMGVPWPPPGEPAAD